MLVIVAEYSIEGTMSDMKQCKQCGRMLEDDCFRKTKSRSQGIYKNTSQGTKTICRSCESLNVRAHRAIKENDEETMATLREHYKRLSLAGYPPVTAAARRLLDGVVTAHVTKENELLCHTSRYDAEVLEHAYKVRTRSYDSVDEADKVHRQLESRLKEADLYEEVTNLLDDWYMDE